MTYLEIIKSIESVVKSHPAHPNFYKHIYNVDGNNDVEFPCVVLTVNSVSENNSLETFNFNLLYADRLTPERDNINFIQSVGKTNLTEMINALRDTYEVFDIPDTITYNVFRGQFAHDCAGIVASNISLVLPSELGQCRWYKVKKECC